MSNPEPVNCVCGSEASSERYTHWFVQCSNQSLDGECWIGPERDTEAEAIEAWNQLMQRKD